MSVDIDKIRALVGPITHHDMRNVEAFYCDIAGLFIPALGQCEYSTQDDHVHPAYMFVILQDLYKSSASLPQIRFTGSGNYIVTAISPGIPHTEEASDDFTRYFALMVDTTFIESVWRQYDIEGPPVLNWHTWVVDSAIQDLLRDFMTEYENGLPGSETLMQAIVLRIVHLLARSFYNVIVNTERVTSRIEVAKALEFMHLRYAQKISVRDVAEYANMSESHFSRVFKKETGQPPLEMLIAIRLNNAKKMLDSTERTISEVAYDCGFATPSHFSSAFSRAFGVSPSRFRKQPILEKQ